MNKLNRFGLAVAFFLSLILSSCEIATVPGPMAIDCSDQSGDLVLTDNPDEAVDYIINCTLTIGGGNTLTIEPGTVIQMGSGAHIRIEQDGRIVANGTEEAPIVIQGELAQPEYWRGIVVESDFDDNSFQYVEMRDGGDWWNVTAYALLQLWGTGSVTINNCTLTNTRSGINIRRSMGLNSFQNNTIQDCDEHPLNIDVIHLGVIDNTNTLTGNTQDHIEARGGRLPADQTWVINTVPVLLSQVVVEENVTLTIQEGVEILMNDDQFIIEGTLKSKGTANNPVIFNGQVQDAPGYWYGIAFKTFSNANEIDYTTISGAGAFDNVRAGNIIMYDGDLSLTNSTIQNSKSCGVHTGGNNLTESNNTFLDNGGDNICQ